MLLAISAVMPLTEWRYLKALPSLGLLFNVASRGGSCRKDAYVCEAATGSEGLLCFLVMVWIYSFLTLNLVLL